VSDPFATAGELAQYIGNTEPTDLARMQGFLASASAVIRKYAGQTLSQVVGDVVIVQPMYSLTTGQAFPLPGAAYGATILLPQRPVTAIASIVANSVSVTAFQFTSAGVITRTDGNGWLYAATITYTHGFDETADEYAAIKNICIEAASRAYTLNERSASEAMGSTLMESAGYAPEVFLTEGEKAQLQFGRAYVG
jgi:hypothetical protein